MTPPVTPVPSAGPVVAPQPTTPVAITEPTLPKPKPPTPAEQSSFASSSNRLGYDLYAKLAAQSGNVAFSPASIETALAMTWAGAHGETAEQMRKVLHFGNDKTADLAAAGKTLGALGAPHADYELRVADRLFGDKTYPFDPGFLATTESAFGAPIDTVDFVHAHETGRLAVNGFVSATTHGHITNLLPEGSVDDTTRLVLVNAVYMHAKWAHPFVKAGTHDEAFYVGESAHDVPMMHQRSELGYADAGDTLVLDMPYKGDDLAMTVLLPKDKNGLSKLEASLHEGSIEAFTNQIVMTEVDVSLPRFKVAPSQSVALKGMLSALGMPLAFDPEHADFTPMGKPGAERLHIDDAYHKAFVDVDEEGTTAAAATAVVVSRDAAVLVEPRPVVVRADHPFVYVIRDVRTNLILFVGRVADPTA